MPVQHFCNNSWVGRHRGQNVLYMPNNLYNKAYTINNYNNKTQTICLKQINFIINKDNNFTRKG